MRWHTAHRRRARRRPKPKINAIVASALDRIMNEMWETLAQRFMRRMVVDFEAMLLGGPRLAQELEALSRGEELPKPSFDWDDYINAPARNLYPVLTPLRDQIPRGGPLGPAEVLNPRAIVPLGGAYTRLLEYGRERNDAADALAYGLEHPNCRCVEFDPDNGGTTGLAGDADDPNRGET